MKWAFPFLFVGPFVTYLIEESEAHVVVLLLTLALLLLLLLLFWKLQNKLSEIEQLVHYIRIFVISEFPRSLLFLRHGKLKLISLNNSWNFGKIQDKLTRVDN